MSPLHILKQIPGILWGLMLLSHFLVVACVPKPLPPSSVCSVNGILLQCPYNTVTLNAQGIQRKVHWQVPQGMPPEGGWPVVIMFQGTAATAPLFWVATPENLLGDITRYKWYNVCWTMVLPCSLQKPIFQDSPFGIPITLWYWIIILPMTMR